MKHVTLYDYQKDGVRQIRDLDGTSFLCDEVGLGKTVQSIYYAWKYLPKKPAGPIVAVVPSHLKEVWRFELQKHLGARAQILSGERVPAGFLPPIDKNSLLVMNYEILSPPHWKSRTVPRDDSWIAWLAALKPRLLIGDEAQALCHSESQRTRAFRWLSRRCPRTMLLSGTPLPNKPGNLWAPLNILWPDEFPSQFDFGCTLPGTLVAGDFIGASKAYYSGDAFELRCASGVNLRVTPNHPIATPQGFVAANLLNEGDELFGHPRMVDGFPNNKTHRPTLVEDAFSSVSQLARVIARLPASLEYFHGDAVGFKNDVDIALSESVLRDSEVSGNAQMMDNLDLINSPLRHSLLPKNCTVGQLGFGHLDPLSFSRASVHGLSFERSEFSSGFANSFADRVLNRSSFFDGVGVPSQFVGFAGVSENTKFDELLLEDAVLLPVLIPKSHKSHSGPVVLDRIIQIRTFKHDGLVYDFQTSNGTYSAGDSIQKSVVVSNCTYSFPHKERGRWVYRGARNLDVLHEKLHQCGMIRRRKADVLKDLPAVSYNVVPLECDLTEYRRAEQDVIAWLAEHSAVAAERASRAAQLAKLNVLKQQAALAKMDAVLRWIDDFHENGGGKLLIGAVHYAVTDILMQHLGKRAVLVDGRINDKKKFAAFERFNKDDECTDFVGNLQAAGTGWSCTSSSNVAFVELPWKPSDVAQFAGRLHGVNRGIPGTAADVRFLIAANTIEGFMCSAIQRKQGWADLAIDGREDDNELDLETQLAAYLQGGKK